MKYSDHIAHYQKDAEHFDYFDEDPFRRQENRRRYETIFDLSGPSHERRILEIGSGGFPAMQSQNLKRVRYFALDLSYKNMKRAKAQPGSTLNAVCADAYHLPFRPDTLDAVVLSEVIEHLESPMDVLKEVKRVLSQNGRLIVTVPFEEKIRFCTCIHCNRVTPVNAHLHTFSAESLSRLVNQCGLAVQSVTCICNKVANRLHVYRWMRYFPFRIWRTADKLFNLLINRPSTIALCAVKGLHQPDGR
ncbi:methyltransferase domain-containing protein [bacterium]|nr:methyltransferase domain-containing protein [bacterium]